jgi:hypothetical protein
LSEFIEFISIEWNLQIIAALSDKDWSKINTFLAKLPDSKIQLCFWHAVMAIQRHLSILHCAPAFYDMIEADAEFDWIDQEFVPFSQCADKDLVSMFIMGVGCCQLISNNQFAG